MKKIYFVSLLLASSLALAGCNQAATTTTTTEPPAQMEPTSSPESMMNAPMMTPSPVQTPVDVSTDAQLKSTKPMGTSDDPKTLKSDLNNTTIVNESYQ